MEDAKKILPSGSQTFEEVRKALYVDKTAYLADIISSSTKTWFFTRPRRFGKSLTVSTLEAVFSGQQDLFEGLAIHDWLNDERFAPRPVIHLDMSDVNTDEGIIVFKETLRRMTAEKAEELDIELPLNLTPAETLKTLIRKCARNFGTQVAILIDEYDTPHLDFLRSNPEELEAVQDTLRNYYRKLKVCDKFISFIFVTGITKLGLTDSYSSFNSYTDISNTVDYGAMTGFTHEEVKKYFEMQIKDTAQSLEITEKQLLEDLEEYYDGFCFDGKTNVYNPYSTLQFFFLKDFRNFWFDSGTPKVLAKFMKKNFLTVDEFRGVSISKNVAVSPKSLNLEEPQTFLYQTGYLCLRTSQVKGQFLLDYPNREVRESMERLVMEKIFGTESKAFASIKRFLEALSRRDPAGVVQELNYLLSKLSFDDYKGAKQYNFTEHMYHANFVSYLNGAGLDYEQEVHTSFGRSDLVIKYITQTNVLVNWVIEIKVCRDDEDDKTRAEDAFNQIIEKQYGTSLYDPVLLGLAINNKKRRITAWKCQGGTQTESEPEASPKVTKKVTRKPKAKGEIT
ncbi:MAG: ATP-binding protein [Deltaproteobacteria bacterium]|jgi:hypothetical protein|nr:ATP-binding protein [Deltaproteobacteria bacterium]